MKQDNEKYCTECGQIILAKAEICPKCGVRQIVIVEQNPQDAIRAAAVAKQRQEWLVCLLLCWFVGVLGVHRFYTGHIGTGIIQLLTLGGCGVWALVDFILIATGDFKDAAGNPIKNV